MEFPFDKRPATADLLHLDTISSWLRKHGKSVRPRLDRRQLDALRECFDIIDTDGTGVITAEELQEVFKVFAHRFSKPAGLCHAQQGDCHMAPLMPAIFVLSQVLGNHVSLQAVASVLDGVKHHGSKGIGFPDFIDIMSRDSRDLANGDDSESNSSATSAYNIALMARAYRCLSVARQQAMTCMCSPARSGLVHSNRCHELVKAASRGCAV